MRRPARGAPRPPRTHRHRKPARREHPAPDRVTMPAQPAPAARTRKQAVTEKRLDAGRAVAYREHWCLQAPSRPSPDFGKKVTGRAVPYPTRSRCRRTPPRRNQNHHENHAHQKRRNHANDAHPEWRLTRRRRRRRRCCWHGMSLAEPRHRPSRRSRAGLPLPVNSAVSSGRGGAYRGSPALLARSRGLQARCRMHVMPGGSPAPRAPSALSWLNLVRKSVGVTPPA
jgi:hypothetical protein